MEVNLLFTIQNPPCLGGTKKLYWGVLEGLYDFFKSNQCCDNILKI